MSYTGSVPDLPRAEDWRDTAACRDEDPELFFPKGYDGPWKLVIAEATAVCARCPSQPACLRWALETGVEFGVWGGLSEVERRALKRRRVRARTGSGPQSLDFDRERSALAQCLELYDRYTEARGIHRVWTAHATTVKIKYRDRTYGQISFHAGHGRWPQGQVKRACNVHQCVAVGCLTDQEIRNARAAAGAS